MNSQGSASFKHTLVLICTYAFYFQDCLGYYCLNDDDCNSCGNSCMGGYCSGGGNPADVQEDLDMEEQ